MITIRSLNELSSHLARHRDLSFTEIEEVNLNDTLPPLLNNTTFIRCRFAEGTVMPEEVCDSVFVECRMVGLAFTGVNLFRTRFIRCDLSLSCFQQCDMAASCFIDCATHAIRLVGCDLDATQLPGLESPDESNAA
jgi:uncharacterized protein YjbI with pentapeptide repeats